MGYDATRYFPAVSYSLIVLDVVANRVSAVATNISSSAPPETWDHAAYAVYE
jgi:hypothetical protein